MEECEMLVTRSWDVFLDEEHMAEVEREWIEAVRGMREFAGKDGKQRGWECLGEVQFLKGANVEKVSALTTSILDSARYISDYLLILDDPVIVGKSC